MEVNGIEISDEFKELVHFLIGTPKQFILEQGNFHCVRKICDENCPYFGGDCVSEPSQIQVDLIPNARRGIGIEECTFLILLFKEGHSFETLPKELWGNKYAEKATDERNLHFILNNPKFKFHSFKGQLRYYGSAAEFLISPYSEYCYIQDIYEPKHFPVSIDYSAIEPKVTTLQTRTKAYQEIFQGTPKVVVREVEISDLKK